MNSHQIDLLADDQHEESDSNTISLLDFIEDFGEGLLEAVQAQNPPIYEGQPDIYRDFLLGELKRKAFEAQRHAIQALATLYFDHQETSAILNGKMGTGKTFMSIALSHIAYHEGCQRFLVICPPHLVYKWAREIDMTVDNAKIYVLNGQKTIGTLLKIREELRNNQAHDGPTYVVLGRVRMRLGFNWVPAIGTKKIHQMSNLDARDENSKRIAETFRIASCPRCNTPFTNAEGENLTPDAFLSTHQNKRVFCSAVVDGKECKEPFWTLYRPGKPRNYKDIVKKGLCDLPTVGPKTAERIIEAFGDNLIGSMLDDNIFDLVNLMDRDGQFIFNDKQARRIEKSLGTFEFSVGDGAYQASEFIKRYLPKDFFDLAIIDEAHEYAASSSAQGLAMGVIASQAKKVLLCTGTLMKGYASDLFYLLWRINGAQLRDDGYSVNKHGSLGPAEMAFMRSHGVLTDIIKETSSGNYKTARGNRVTVSTRKAPGISPRCITQYLLPRTVFVKLQDISDQLPPYNEEYVELSMTSEQCERYEKLESELNDHLRKSLARGDTTLLGVVINSLLAWPDTCFKPEVVKHPRSRELLHFCPSMFDADEPTPKEAELIRKCLEAKKNGIRTLVYTVYTGTRDTATRLKQLLSNAGLNFAVLRSTVPADQREDWIENQVSVNNVDGLITNPKCVETGLDLLDFNQIVFMQTGLETNTVEQAAKRSWRIGQKLPVNVLFIGYQDTAQTACLELMAKKIAVSQSTSGEVPETGLDALNSDGDSIEVALAKKLVA